MGPFLWQIDYPTFCPFLFLEIMRISRDIKEKPQYRIFGAQKKKPSGGPRVQNFFLTFSIAHNQPFIKTASCMTFFSAYIL